MEISERSISGNISYSSKNPTHYLIVLFLNSSCSSKILKLVYVYRDNRTPGIIKSTTHIFMHGGWLWSICSSHAGLSINVNFQWGQPSSLPAKRSNLMNWFEGLTVKGSKVKCLNNLEWVPLNLGPFLEIVGSSAPTCIKSPHFPSMYHIYSGCGILVMTITWTLRELPKPIEKTFFSFKISVP